jgi:hypothetical protein
MTGEESGEATRRAKARHSRHAIQASKGLEVEPPRSTSRHVAIRRREMTVAISIGSRRCDVCRIHDVGIDELKLQQINTAPRYSEDQTYIFLQTL